MRIADFNAPAADNISKLIEEKGLKQVYVAQKAGYKAQELNDMLNGRRLIKACDVPRLALALNVEINEIYESGKKGE
ncbi:MAG TPA: helix-turn-helix domain-containing protein [Candidatus Mediterraneibacter merdigallinarum]|nr:helix-turn-helix domain-containing protein [Candidatus Mediterraneibacter merdigallinarum]